MMSSLFRWFRPRRGAVVNRTAGRKKTPCKLYVEALEDRSVPSVTLQSALSVDSSGGVQPFGIAVDTAGNTYMTGAFSGTADFDPLHPGTDGVLTASGSRDAFVAMYAPDNSLVWARQMGGSNSSNNYGGLDRGVSIQIDGSGNVYVTGTFAGTGVFGSFNLTSAGGGDVFVTKLNSSGTFQWADRWGTAIPNEQGGGVGVDAAGNVYALTWTSATSNASITAATWNSSTKTATITAANNFAAGQPVEMSGMTPSGYNGYYTILSASASSFTYSLQQNPHGNGTAFGTATANQGAFDVLKFNPSGSAVWDMSINNHAGGSGSLGENLAVNASGNVFVGGDFGGNVDFDPGSGTHYVSSPPGAYSGFVLNLNTNGQFGWVSPFMTSLGTLCTINSIALDGSGNVIVGGMYYGAVDFNPGAGTTILPGTQGGYITKLNSAGALVWANALESNNATTVNGLAVDAAGNIYATGGFAGTTDFNPGSGTYSLTSAGQDDVFVMKLDSAGNFDWAYSFGSTGNDIGYGIAVDSAGTVYLDGYYEGTVNFSPDPNNPYWLTDPNGTYTSMFFVKLTQS
jgi:hypothetical protein